MEVGRVPAREEGVMPVKVTNWESGKAVSTLEWVGAVVETGSTYIGDGDSYYWSIVFDPYGEKPFKQVGTGYWQEGWVDAPEELLEAYKGVKAAEAALAKANSVVKALASEVKEADWEFEAVKKGKWVQVVKGRKVPKGTVGQVKWVGEGQWGMRLLMETLSGEEVWTALSNVEALVESTVAPKPLTPAEQARAMGLTDLAEYIEAQEAAA